MERHDTKALTRGLGGKRPDGNPVPEVLRRAGTSRLEMSPTFGRIYAAVSRIPRGRVATYWQIAEIAGFPRQPRLVGYALSALPDSRGVPWHRVINARGAISERSEPGFELIQRVMLEREGVVFDAGGRVSLRRYRWRPRWQGSRADAPGRSRVRSASPRPVRRASTRRTMHR